MFNEFSPVLSKNLGSLPKSLIKPIPTLDFDRAIKVPRVSDNILKLAEELSVKLKALILDGANRLLLRRSDFLNDFEEHAPNLSKPDTLALFAVTIYLVSKESPSSPLQIKGLWGLFLNSTTPNFKVSDHTFSQDNLRGELVRYYLTELRREKVVTYSDLENLKGATTEIVSLRLHKAIGTYDPYQLVKLAYPNAFESPDPITPKVRPWIISSATKWQSPEANTIATNGVLWLLAIRGGVIDPLGKIDLNKLKQFNWHRELRATKTRGLFISSIIGNNIRTALNLAENALQKRLADNKIFIPLGLNKSHDKLVKVEGKTKIELGDLQDFTDVVIELAKQRFPSIVDRATGDMIPSAIPLVNWSTLFKHNAQAVLQADIKPWEALAITLPEAFGWDKSKGKIISYSILQLNLSPAEQLKRSRFLLIHAMYNSGLGYVEQSAAGYSWNLTPHFVDSWWSQVGKRPNLVPGIVKDYRLSGIIKDRTGGSFEKAVGLMFTGNLHQSIDPTSVPIGEGRLPKLLKLYLCEFFDNKAKVSLPNSLIIPKNTNIIM